MSYDAEFWQLPQTYPTKSQINQDEKMRSKARKRAEVPKKCPLVLKKWCGKAGVESDCAKFRGFATFFLNFPNRTLIYRWLCTDIVITSSAIYGWKIAALTAIQHGRGQVNAVGRDEPQLLSLNHLMTVALCFNLCYTQHFTLIELHHKQHSFDFIISRLACALCHIFSAGQRLDIKAHDKILQTLEGDNWNRVGASLHATGKVLPTRQTPAMVIITIWQILMVYKKACFITKSRCTVLENDCNCMIAMGMLEQWYTNVRNTFDAQYNIIFNTLRPR